MRFTPTLVSGVALTLLGVLLLLDRLGTLDIRTVVQYWPVLLTLFGVSVVVQALRGAPEEGASRRHGRHEGAGGVLFFVVLWLAVSGAFAARSSSGDPEPTLVGIIGLDAHTSVARPFRSAQMTSVMGRTRLDLRQATIAEGGEAVVDVFGLMGGAEILVPETWTVDVQATAVMGAVRDRRGQRADTRDDGVRRNGRSNGRDQVSPPATLAPLQTGAVEPAAGAPRIVLRGVVVAGGLVIRS